LAVNRPERSGRVMPPDSTACLSDLLRAGSKASKGRTAWRGRLRRSNRKRHEPQDWKHGAIPVQGWGGGIRHGGGKPRRRNTRRVGDLSPKRSWQQQRGSGLLSLQDSGGAIFGNLNETIVRRTGGSSRASWLIFKVGSKRREPGRSGRNDDDEGDVCASRGRRARTKAQEGSVSELVSSSVPPGGVPVEAGEDPKATTGNGKGQRAQDSTGPTSSASAT
jgi:hypothetical protein